MPVKTTAANPVAVTSPNNTIACVIVKRSFIAGVFLKAMAARAEAEPEMFSEILHHLR
jgi:pyrimidine deaminase RibD-like protein